MKEGWWKNKDILKRTCFDEKREGKKKPVFFLYPLWIREYTRSLFACKIKLNGSMHAGNI